MCPIEQCHWNSLGFVVVMARTSSGKYWFLAIHSKTCHLQVWAQSCPKKMLSVQFWKMSSPCRRPMCLDADFMTFLKTSWFWVWCQMHTIKQCPWDSLGFGVVMARSSAVKYWFLAIHAKTYHLQVWYQCCLPQKPELIIFVILKPLFKAMCARTWDIWSRPGPSSGPNLAQEME